MEEAQHRTAVVGTPLPVAGAGSDVTSTTSTTENWDAWESQSERTS